MPKGKPPSLPSAAPPAWRIAAHRLLSRQFEIEPALAHKLETQGAGCGECLHKLHLDSVTKAEGFSRSLAYERVIAFGVYIVILADG
jgi:hypothetical protein